MNRRRFLLKQKQGELPAGYRRVEYLESNGKEIINTKIVPTTYMQMYIDFQFTKNSNGMCGYYQANNRYYPLYLLGTISVATLGEGTVRSIEGYNSNRHTIIFNNENGKVTYDGTERNITVRNTINASTSVGGIGLFAQGGTMAPSGGVPSQPCYMRIYEVVLTDLSIGQEVFRALPCLDENGVPCMYDTVSKQPFYNQGAGELIYSE